MVTIFLGKPQRTISNHNSFTKTKCVYVINFMDKVSVNNDLEHLTTMGNGKTNSAGQNKTIVGLWRTPLGIAKKINLN